MSLLEKQINVSSFSVNSIELLPRVNTTFKETYNSDKAFTDENNFAKVWKLFLKEDNVRNRCNKKNEPFRWQWGDNKNLMLCLWVILLF